MRKYPEEIKQFIADNANGMYVRDLVEKLNSTFGTDYTYVQISSYKKNHNIRSYVPTQRATGSRLFTREMEKYLHENVKGSSVIELTNKLNYRFNSAYTKEQVKTYMTNHKLTNGLNTQFKKGGVSHNKGKKGVYAKGSEKGWFQKGNSPVNHRPVGSERIDSKDGYVLIKVAEPRTWRLKHRVIWEQHYGEIPKDCVVIFLDGDKLNLDISNLALITRNELRIMNQQGLKSEDAALTQAGVLVAKLIDKKHKRKVEK